MRNLRAVVLAVSNSTDSLNARGRVRVWPTASAWSFSQVPPLKAWAGSGTCQPIRWLAQSTLAAALLCGLVAFAAGGAAASGQTNVTPQPSGPAATSRQLASLNWISFPDPRLAIHGLPWFKENSPELWRLPKSAKDNVPQAVWNRAQAPGGGRIRFTCSTAGLGLRVQVAVPHRKPCYFEAYVNGEAAGSAEATGTEPVELLLFENKGRAKKDITIYLPHTHRVRVLAVGLDAEASLKPPSAFALKRPFVCYGSSVLQGTGAAHPSKTYPAVLARRLNLDFVNLGFGGAGKAETNVVALVNQLDACGFLFDLGKSYGAQPAAPYARMLDTLRAGHADAPVFCVTPIYSIKEGNEPDYHVRSENLRTLMRQAAADHIKAGDQRMFVVEGLELFGEADKDAFSDPLHPNDEGNERMARRLEPVVRKALLGGTRPP